MNTLLHIERPALQRAGSRTPVVVLLHGWGMYQEHLFELTRSFDPRLDVVSPRAPVRMGPGVYRWFDFVRRPDAGPLINDSEEVASLRTLTAFIEQVTVEKQVDGVYLVGHSQGGTMALSLALARPDLVKGCANVNGRILDKAYGVVEGRPLLADKPFFNGHGTDNDIVPLRVGRQTCTRLVALGAALHTQEYPIGHEINGAALADVSDWLGACLDRAGQ